MVNRSAMKDSQGFIRAYHEFRSSVDFSRAGILPELNDLIWCMLMGIPEVPADGETAPGAPLKAVDQRVAILKAVFVELNRDQTDAFIDKGMVRYDEAGHRAKELLHEGSAL